MTTAERWVSMRKILYQVDNWIIRVVNFICQVCKAARWDIVVSLTAFHMHSFYRWWISRHHHCHVFTRNISCSCSGVLSQTVSPIFFVLQSNLAWTKHLGILKIYRISVRFIDSFSSVFSLIFVLKRVKKET